MWGFNILLGTALIALLVSVLHLQPNLAQVVTIVLVTVSSFLGHRFFSFRHGRTWTRRWSAAATAGEA